MEKLLRKFLLCLHVKNFSAVDAANENEAGHPARWAPTGVDWNLPSEETLRRQKCGRTQIRVPIRHSLRTGEQLPDGLFGAGRQAAGHSGTSPAPQESRNSRTIRIGEYQNNGNALISHTCSLISLSALLYHQYTN